MNVHRLNINDGGKPTLGYDGDDQVFHEIEAIVGRPIPSIYRDLIREHNGGHPELDCFYPQGELNTENSFGLDKIYSVSRESVEGVFWVLRAWGEALGSGMLPIGADGGDNQIYMNLNDQEGTVWLYLHDQGGKRIKLADNLEDFLDGLTTNPDYI
jgi:hypothetical protein